MTSLVVRLGAIAAAGAIIATAAIPAYADLGPAPKAEAAPAAPQSVALISTAVDVTATARDSYSVTRKVVVKPSVANLWTGGPAPAQVFSGEAVLAYAATFVGKVPYGMGNSPDTSFSCDGFTQYVFAGFGISLPRGADHQARLGVRISQAEAQAGDFVYWPGQHIGIYDGAGGMYNSPNWGRYVEHVSTLWGSPLFIRLR